MEKFYDDSYAVLIGIGKFKSNGIYQLPNPVNDVENMSQTLEKYCDFDSNYIYKFVDKKATKDNIETIFDSTLHSKIKTNDRLLVYYSGHGITRKDYGGVGKHLGYLVPYDSKLAGKGYRYTTLIEFNSLLVNIQKSINVRQILFILDCCFSGIATNELGVQSEFEKGLCKNDMIIAGRDLKSVQILTAGGPNEEILDSGRNPQISILNDSIQQIIEKENPADHEWGYLSARNIAKKSNLIVGRRSILLKKSQTPRFSNAKNDDNGEFVFRTFTDAEITDSQQSSVVFDKIEKLINDTKLKTIFSRENLLEFENIVTQKYGEKYSLNQVRIAIYQAVKDNSKINETIDQLIQKEKDLSLQDKKNFSNYISENILAIGFSRNIFNPHFIEFDDTEKVVGEA